ncbi:heme utilization protein [Pseudomonas jinjuensis]
MAVAVQANDRNDRHDRHDRGHGHEHHQKRPPYDPHTDPRIFAGAVATLEDSQNNTDNFVINQATENDAEVTDSLNDVEGNAGLNVAAGDMNQQDNETALASSDAEWIFGGAYASTSANQYQTGNTALNFSTTNTANLDGSANDSSGNIGVNVAAGDFNQQKNMMAAAVSSGRFAIAEGPVDQDTTGNVVANTAVPEFDKVTLRSEFKAHGKYEGKGYGVVVDDGKKGYGRHSKPDLDPMFFHEEGDVYLSGYATHQVLVFSGWTAPVINTATVNNSLNGAQGNVGANVAAGVGNQQANSLTIAAGCQTCL